MKRKNESNKNLFKYEGSECPVCMEDMRPESRSVTSPCMHEFCLQCIGKWLTESSSSLCPLCKQSVKLIIYNIRKTTKFSKISFPKGFHDAWSLRNKIKNILDNFEEIINKIYQAIGKFLSSKKNELDEKILIYLTYFGGLKYRLKSRPSNEIIEPIKVTANHVSWTIVEKLVSDRLLIFFTASHTNKIIDSIKSNSKTTFGKYIDLLKKHIDRERFEILKSEIVTCIQMDEDLSVFIEYYVPGSHEHVIYSHRTLTDDSVAAALITRIIARINIDFSNNPAAGNQIRIMDHIYSMPDNWCFFEKLLAHLSFSTHYVLLNTGFYQASHLKKLEIHCDSIPAATCDLIKHCFHQDDFSQIADALTKFEDKYIFFEPFSLTDDDSSSAHLIPDSPVLSEIVIELSDTEIDDYDDDDDDPVADDDDDDDDSDALEIISFNPPVFDLTESVSSDDEIVSIIDDNVPPVVKKPKILVSDSEAQEFYRLIDFCASSNLEPTTSQIASAITEEIDLSAPIVVPQSFPDPVEFLDCSPVSLSSVLDVEEEHQVNESPKKTEKFADFIYQPRSVNDFYEYLMSKNSSNNDLPN